MLLRNVLSLTVLALLPAAVFAQPAPMDLSEVFAEMSYRTVGPARGGRVTAVAGHRAQPATFYMGATGGGVWKTTDSGDTWHNVSDGFFASPSIGAIQVAQTDPKTVYVGTGSDGLRSNVIIGKGVYKSTDGGATWAHLGLENVGNIGAVLIHPEDSNLVYVAAIGNPFAPNPERGVYRSRDGGENWEQVLFVSERTGAVDLEFAPDDSQRIYATLWRAERKPWTIISGGYEGGVYRSTDGGDNWEALTQGLPGGLRGKADLAVSGGDPNRVYVLIEAPGKDGGVYRSDDRGDTWRQISDFARIQTRPFYYCNLEAHPWNPDILWGMTEGFWKSIDAGATWTQVPTPHGDNHDMWINPDNPNIYVQANDGGANVTLNGGKTWSTQLNQPTAELYQVDVSDEFPYRLYAGQQDNTTISIPSMPERSEPGGYTAMWESHGGCETGPVVPKPGDPDIVYANCKGRFGLYNRRTGREQQYYVGFWNLYGHNPRDLAYRFQRVAPVHVSPHNPDRVYHASQFVHVTEDGGKTWETISGDLTAFTPETQVVSGTPITLDSTGEEHFSTLYDVQESPHEAGVIWAGANDGPVHITRDGGKNWTDVTPPGLGPHGRVQQIEASPHQPGKAYVAILRYQLGDFAPYAFKTEDYGATWTRITQGIPDDYPVRVVREDPDREGLLYAGTEFGAFVSLNDGADWQSLQLNLPVTPITDMKVVQQDLVLSTMGRGFWILDDITPLHELTPDIAGTRAHLFDVRDAYRLRFGGQRQGRALPSDPEYPSPAAHIDYLLADDVLEEVRLEILDSEGTVLRRFSTIPDWDFEGGLTQTAGWQRFRWNLRYAGLEGDDPGKRRPAPSPLPKPEDLDPAMDAAEKEGPEKKDPRQAARAAARRLQSGPRVPPGTYQARLTVGDWSAVKSFEVKMDPRVVAEGLTAAEVRRQTELSLQVRDTINEVRNSYKKAEDALEAVRRQLMAEPVRYSQPKLLDQLKYLYYGLDRADQVPGQDAYQRYEELSRSLAAILEELERIAGDGSEP